MQEYLRRCGKPVLVPSVACDSGMRDIKSAAISSLDVIKEVFVFRVDLVLFCIFGCEMDRQTKVRILEVKGAMLMSRACVARVKSICIIYYTKLT